MSQQNCPLEMPALLRCGTLLRNGVMIYGYVPAAPRSPPAIGVWSFDEGNISKLEAPCGPRRRDL
jgi:hypothetical protein